MQCSLGISEIRERLRTLGIPVTYLCFKTPQQLPYVVFYEAGTEIKGADHYNLYRDVEIKIELYASEKTSKLERKIENLFRDTEIEKECDAVIEQKGSNVILTVFAFKTVQYIEEEENEEI